MTKLSEVKLLEEEVEALRLAHLKELYHDSAAASMNISRQTFGRILNSAHKKVADAIINCKALKIDIDKTKSKNS